MEFREDETATLQKTHTSCKDCVFAQYTTPFNEQTGCELGRIEKWREQSPDTILEAYDYQDIDGVSVTKNFFIVNGKLCNAHRNTNSRWAGEFQGDLAKSRVYEEIKLKVALFVYMDENTTIEQLEKTLGSIKAQHLLPYQVFLINNGGVPPGKINAVAMEVLGNETTWRVNTILQREPDGSRISRECSLHVATAVLKNPAVSRVPCATYCTVVNTGFELPPDFIAALDKAVNHDLDSFRLLTPIDVDGNCLTVQVFLLQHPHVGGWDVWKNDEGHVVTDIVEKVKIMAEEYGSPNLIKAVGTICPSLCLEVTA